MREIREAMGGIGRVECIRLKRRPPNFGDTLQIFTFSGEGDFDRIFGVDNNRYLPQLCVVDVRKARP